MIDPTKIDTIARALVAPDAHPIALTGAGISVESGIPDFRSAGGLWERFDPMEYATIDAFKQDPRKVWRMILGLEELLVQAAPNPAHTALANLEQAGALAGIVTQNIDNLHQRAGSATVVEFHGNGRRLRCLSCHKRYDAAEAEALGSPPACACGKILKPDVVFFGEAIPSQAMADAHDFARRARVVLVVGTSATVYPFAGLPSFAASRGAMLVEVNLEPTGLTGQCDVALHASASEVLPALAARVEELVEERSG